MSNNENLSKILAENGSVVISASAGTGKTYAIAEKIKFDYKISNSYKTYAAITFTNAAAEELKQRLSSVKNGFVGTNDSFVLNEIIKPFARDVFRKLNNIEIKPDYADDNAMNTLEELELKFIENGTIRKYKDKKRNYIFELALIIVKESHAASRYLKCKYSKFFIDEYQDTDIDMHSFFMYLFDELSIPLFIVGDDKQSIYRWRGANPECFKSLLRKEKFVWYNLFNNFRSNQEIINYSNLFDESVKDNSVFRLSPLHDEVCYLNFVGNDDNSFQMKIEHWLEDNKNRRVAILTYRHEDAQFYAACFRALGFEYIPRDPFQIDTINNEQVWLMKNITRYFLEDHYNEYSFINEIPYFDYDSVTNLTKQIKQLLKDIKNHKSDEELLKSNIWRLYEIIFSYNIDNESFKEEFECFKQSLESEDAIIYFNSNKYKRIATTIHTAKGLSFDQVIILDCDFNNIKDNQDNKNLHYVAITRPREKLLILTNNINESHYFSYVYNLISHRGKQFNEFIQNYDEVYANQVSC